MSTKEYIWNCSRWSNQQIKKARHQRGCRKAAGPDCGGAFKCSMCEKLHGWCRGAGDLYKDICDGCWARQVGL